MSALLQPVSSTSILTGISQNCLLIFFPPGESLLLLLGLRGRAGAVGHPPRHSRSIGGKEKNERKNELSEVLPVGTLDLKGHIDNILLVLARIASVYR